MSLSNDQVGREATKFLDEAHHRHDIDTEFNGLGLRDQWRVTKAMQHMNAAYEADHPVLPKVQIGTFNDGQLKDLEVSGRLWGWNSCYHRDKDPGVPQPVKNGFKQILNGLKEVFDP